jgi:hypothetical protein
MAAITRANPYLEEIIEMLDQHLSKCNGNMEAARDRLSAIENEWIDNEVFQCMVDSRYFISNYYAIRTEDKGFQGLYPFWDSQEILYEEYKRLRATYGTVRAMVLKARQMGSTTYNIAEFFHSTIFSEHVNGLIVAQDEDVSSYVMGMYESALDFMPWWMRPRIKIKQTGSVINFDEKDEALRASRPGLKTWIYADNARKPTGVGRSKTFGRAMLTELAFWQNAKQLSKSLLPTFNTADGFYIMESTANGRNDAWHNLWRRAEAGELDFHPIFIPFYRRDKTYSLPILPNETFVLTKEEEEMRTRIMVKDRFVIKDATFNWMRKKKQFFIATDGDDAMFGQEYTSEPEESFTSSAITAFPRGTIRKFTKRTVEPGWIGEISYDFNLGKPHLTMKELGPGEEAPYPKHENRFHIWAKPVRGERYTMGVDVALGNEGGDYSCIQVLKTPEDYQLDEQVACWHGYIDPSGLAEIVLAIGWYYNEALAAVEVNSMGMVTNNELVRNLEYENIYRFKRMDRLKNFMTDIIGFWTDEKSKRALMAKMSRAFLDEQILIRDKYTMDEFNDFTEDGALGEGAHDDFVMAKMIALYCGHEGEMTQRQNAKTKAVPANSNSFDIKDRNGTIIATTTSQNQAESIAKKHPGCYIERTAGATASVILGGRKRQVPSDFQNTDMSPIHDRQGTAHKLYYDEDVPAEAVTPEMVAEYDAAEEMEEVGGDPDSWRWE